MGTILRVVQHRIRSWSAAARLAASVLVWAGLLNGACAQLPQTVLRSIHPAGAQRGTVTDVTISSGADLDDASQLLFSHPGITAVRRTDSNGSPLVNEFRVSVDAGVEAGICDVRVLGRFGLSNPIAFRIDILPELRESEPNNDSQTAQLIAINSIVNGRSDSAADVDFFRIEARAGQRFAVRCEAAAVGSLMQPVIEILDARGNLLRTARRILSRDPVLICNPESDGPLLIRVADLVYAGNADHRYRLAVDTRPIIDAATSRWVAHSEGSSDEPPAVITPLILGRMLPDGQATDFTVDGAALTRAELSLRRAPGADPVESYAADTPRLTYSTADGTPVTMLRLPPDISLESVVSDAALDDSADSPDTVEMRLPAAVNGVFEEPGDTDSFRFRAVAGQDIAVSVFAERAGSAAWPVVTIESVTADESGTETRARLIQFDRNERNPGGNQIPTLTSDVVRTWKVPNDGEYLISFRDRYGTSRGDLTLWYTALIRDARPDFSLLAFESLPHADRNQPPSTGAVAVRRGGTYQLPVYLLPESGFSAEVRIEAVGLPDGVAISCPDLSAGATSVTAVLTVAEDASPSVFPLLLRGTADVTSADGAVTRLVREARAGTLVHAGGNGLYRTGRLADRLLIGITDDPQPATVVPQVTSATVSPGQQLLIPLTLIRRREFNGRVTMQTVGQPANTDVAAGVFEPDQTQTTARLYFRPNAPPGRADLLMYATADVPYRRRWQEVTAARELAAQAAAERDEAASHVDMLKQLIVQHTETETRKKEAVTELQKKIIAIQSEAASVSDRLILVTAAQRQVAGVLSELSVLDGQLPRDSQKELDARLSVLRDQSRRISAEAEKLREQSTRQRESVRLLQKHRADLKKSRSELEDLGTRLEAARKALAKAMAGMAAAEKRAADTATAAQTAEENAKKTDESNKPEQRKLSSISVPIELNLIPTWGSLTATVPENGQLKRGSLTEVSVRVSRADGNTGPVTISLQSTPGTTGISAEPVIIPAEQTEGLLKISAAPDAPEGDVLFPAVRGTMQRGDQSVHADTPIALKVVSQ